MLERFIHISAPTFTACVYNNTITFLTSNEFFDLVFSGLYHELYTLNTEHQYFFIEDSSPSRYKLPSNVNADDLTFQLRNECCAALTFINNWNRNSSIPLSGEVFSTYENYFKSSLDLIISHETVSSIKEDAIILKSRLNPLYKYLGAFHGNLSSCSYDLNAFLIFLSLIFIYSLRF